MDERIRTYEGALDATGLRVGIVVGRFYDDIIERLLEGAVETLLQAGADPADIEVVYVPGAFEIPLAVRRILAVRRPDAVIALGCVIRGATPHFDYVAGEASRGIARASYDHDTPVSFGVLTVDSRTQALERAGSGAGNKGVEAARAAIQLARVLRRIERQSPGA